MSYSQEAKRKAQVFASSLALCAALSTAVANATDDARNIYLLGSAGVGAGVVPAPGIYITDLTYVYEGSTGASTESLRGGQIRTGVDANAVVNAAIATWVLPQSVVGGNVGFSLILPYGYTEVSADVTLTGPRGRSLALGAHDDVFAVGDPQAIAFLGWHLNELHGKIYALVNVPLGQWSKTNLANSGFNQWAVDIGGAFTWLDKPSGVEVSTAVGLTYNFTNQDDDYKSGKEFHLEYAVAKHFSESALALGVTGYYYKQISGDSGSSARLGSFKGEVAAVGPVVNFTIMVGQQPIVVEAKVFHEFYATNRLAGTAGYLALTFPIP